MNNTIFFWNKWDKPVKAIYWFGLICFMFSIAFMLYVHHKGIDNVFSWKKVANVEEKKVVVDQFEYALTPHQISTKAYLTTNKFKGGPTLPSTNYVYVFVSLVGLGIIFCLSAISTFKHRVWFAVGIASIIAFLALLKLDNLEINGQINKTALIIATVLILGVSCTFYFIEKQIAFHWKLLTFTTIAVICVWLANMTSEAISPMLNIANFGILAPILVSLVFVGMIAFDILNGFFYLSTRAKSQSKSGNVISMSVISILYLGNLTLLFLDRIDFLHLDLFYFEPTYLLVISAIIGIWGQAARSENFADILEHAPGGAYLYLGMGIICMATFGYAEATATDSLVIALEKLNIYIHLGFGIIFLVYLFLNFFEVTKSNLPAYKVVFQPKNFPLFSVRVIGIGLVIIFMLGNNWGAYNSWVAAENTFKADIFSHESKVFTAKGNVKKGKQLRDVAHKLYLEGTLYDPLAIRANTEAANIYAQLYQENKTSENLKECLYYYHAPIFRTEYNSPINFVNYANALKEYSDDKVGAIKILVSGTKYFPVSGELNTNVALSFFDHQVHHDSVGFYLDRANQYLNDPVTNRTNGLAYQLKWPKDNYQNVIDKKETKGQFNFQLEVNELLMDYMKGKGTQHQFDIDKMQDSILNGMQYLYLNNYVLNKLDVLGSKISFEKYMNTESPYFDDIIRLKAFYNYFSGNKLEAYQDFKYLMFDSPTRVNPNNAFLLGKLYLRDGDYTHALDCFTKSNNLQLFKTNQAPFYNAFLATLSQNDSLAISKWEEYKKIDKETANQFLRLYQIKYSETDSLTLDEQFNYIYFIEPSLAGANLDKFNDLVYKTQLGLKYVDQLLATNQVEKAVTLLNELSQYSNLSTYLKNKINFRKLNTLVQTQQYEELLTSCKKLSLNQEKENLRLYFEGIANAGLGNYEEAEKLLEKAIYKNPTNVPVIQFSVEYIWKNRNKKLFAFDILKEVASQHENSLALLTLYAKLCYVNNYDAFAMSTLKEINNLLHKQPEVYDRLETEIKQYEFLDQNLEE